MKRITLLCLAATGLFGCHSDKQASAPTPTTAAAALPVPASSAPVYAFQEKTIDGDAVRLDRYAGKVLLIVNVASKCGFTPQYEGLEKLYDKHQSEGLEILGFPSDQFGHQVYQFLRKEQPGNFTKDSPGAEKLYSHLEKSTPEVLDTDAIKWNFTKFLVDRQGNVLKRFESMETPEQIEPAIVEQLAKK